MEVKLYIKYYFVCYMKLNKRFTNILTERVSNSFIRTKQFKSSFYRHVITFPDSFQT